MMSFIPSRRPGSRRVRGFSLLEMITAAGVAAVILAVVVPQMAQAWKQSRATQSAMNHLELTQAILDQELETYLGFTTSSLLDVAPESMKINGSVYNLYGGAVLAAPAVAVSMDGGFTTSINGRGLLLTSRILPKEACISVYKTLISLEDLNYISVNSIAAWIRNYQPETNTIKTPEVACNKPANLLQWQIL